MWPASASALWWINRRLERVNFQDEKWPRVRIPETYTLPWFGVFQFSRDGGGVDVVVVVGGIVVVVVVGVGGLSARLQLHV
ncbi:hypothetical protein Pmani_037691 [Petrolisthes manimaculis]|uniref:Uncharacterized protein n=1 Tax=Petrolisthes manimaculis TaxID=1843537 RepID=A0AAE1NH66_9EUCA|nr:hypothetical protein Pmani_037691 [Petrolisthes manimaculis]